MKVAIICEGKSDKAFLEDFTQHLKIATKPNFYVCVGKSNLLNSTYRKYQELKDVVAAEPHKLLFVVDADDVKDDACYGGLENTQRALNQLIAELKLDADCDTYIMRDPTASRGNLESLILSTMPADQNNCILSFLNCSKFQSKEKHKIVLTKIYEILYPNTPYDFSHAHFDELKSKLLALFASE